MTEEQPIFPATGGARASFPQDEARHDWLPRLLDAHQVANEGVAEGIRREQAQGRALACHQGCSACCRTHRDIPVYPLELIGISWYAVEKVEGATREKLKTSLRAHAHGDPCPFLIDDACSIHPLRPLACREFNVFGAVCAPGEDAFHTRRGDVLSPSRRHVDAAFDIMLPFHGISKKVERRRVIESGEIHRLVRVLTSLPWHTLAARMDDFDRRREIARAAAEALANGGEGGAA